jgi:hypothetical protein
MNAGVSTEPRGNRIRVAVAEEPVTRGDRMAIRREHRLGSGKGTHQHQQGRLGQVEVGDHRIDAAKGVPGTNEQARLAVERARRTVPAGGLEGAHHRGPDRDHPSAAGMRRLDAPARAGAHPDPLGVHVVVLEAPGTHRLEGPRADVQGHEVELDAALANRLEQLPIEVQAGGRRGHRARIAREHRLVAGLVAPLRRAADVWRQRHRAVRLEQRLERVFAGIELELEQVRRARGHGRPGGVGEAQPGSGAGRLAGAHVGEKAPLAGLALDQHLGAPAARLARREPRLDHPGVVEHQQIARRQQLGEIGESAVGQRPAGAVEHQQPARPALGERRLGNELLGQVEVEVARTHGARC